MMQLFLIINSIITIVSAYKGAIYIDNGNHETAIDRFMSPFERLEMEQELLNLLGLPRRPHKLANNHLKRAAPKFLMDVYNSLLSEENNRSKRSCDVSFNDKEQQNIEESDTIMTFESLNYHNGTIRHLKGKQLWFDLSGMQSVQDIVGAELRIFQRRKHHRHFYKYRITAYAILDFNDNSIPNIEPVASVNTTSDFKGWLSFNLTACMNNWVIYPNSNKGIYLTIQQINKPNHKVHPSDVGLVTVKDKHENQPFLVVFLKAINQVKPKRRMKRSAPPKTEKSKFPNFFMQNMQINQTKECQRHSLYISFKDLQWSDWIIAPDGYSAYFCKGECSFPLHAHMNATNHAIVQTLMHINSSGRFPKPCCAPTKLQNISVLYFIDDKNVVLKKYKKMVVKSCGCH
ncbi:unnamed protein product [Brassicogethes aeneus]|uniref:TGF-beta family profile domain-containing protein n=1 Tax=Brassicogethes aeneus TaxID=1431903 RepID=A0A9P0AZ71_BRAAE|nr:unnamed protein product [Brassicogethes aeneus]